MPNLHKPSGQVVLVINRTTFSAIIFSLFHDKILTFTRSAINEINALPSTKWNCKNSVIYMMNDEVITPRNSKYIFVEIVKLINA